MWKYSLMCSDFCYRIYNLFKVLYTRLLWIPLKSKLTCKAVWLKVSRRESMTVWFHLLLICPSQISEFMCVAHLSLFRNKGQGFVANIKGKSANKTNPQLKTRKNVFGLCHLPNYIWRMVFEKLSGDCCNLTWHKLLDPNEGKLLSSISGKCEIIGRFLESVTLRIHEKKNPTMWHVQSLFVNIIYNTPTICCSEEYDPWEYWETFVLDFVIGWSGCHGYRYSTDTHTTHRHTAVWLQGLMCLK